MKKNYSILRVGNEYVVQADEKSVLKISSRRKAARTVSDAAELLERQPVLESPPLVQSAPSIDCDVEISPDPSEVS